MARFKMPWTLSSMVLYSVLSNGVSCRLHGFIHNDVKQKQQKLVDPFFSDPIIGMSGVITKVYTRYEIA